MVESLLFIGARVGAGAGEKNTLSRSKTERLCNTEDKISVAEQQTIYLLYQIVKSPHFSQKIIGPKQLYLVGKFRKSVRKGS